MFSMAYCLLLSRARGRRGANGHQTPSSSHTDQALKEQATSTESHSLSIPWVKEVRWEERASRSFQLCPGAFAQEERDAGKKQCQSKVKLKVRLRRRSGTPSMNPVRATHLEGPGAGRASGKNMLPTGAPPTACHSPEASES